MFTSYRTRAFVLSRENRGEADKRVTFFSKEFGLVEVVGKSLRKIDSKLRGGVLPFSLSSIEFIQGRRFNILTFAETEKNFPSLKKELPKLRVCYKMRDLIQRFVREPEPDERLWRFLAGALERLEGESFDSRLDPYLFYLYFSWRFLSLLGYGLELYQCTSCGKKLCPRESFLFQGGGPICEVCAKGSREEKIKVSRRCLKVLRGIEKKPFSFVRRIKLGKEDFLELDKTLNFYVNNI